MPEKTRKALEKERKPINKKWLAISVTISAIILLGVILYQFLWRTSEGGVNFSLKAAIIDQLSEDFYNKDFVDNITTILREYNFTVTYYDYTKTKVNFFEGLAKGNYGIIILRLHSALRENGLAVDFFTSEPYAATRYKDLQNEGLLVEGKLNYSGDVRRYFAFTSTFVERLDGTFPKSIIIAMGCQTLNQTVKQMAKAFIGKGAKVYIGWSSWVSVAHSDNEAAKLIERLLYEDETVEEAVKKAYKDQDYGAYLDFYPESAKDLRISDLIKEVQVSSAFIKSVVLKGLMLWQGLLYVLIPWPQLCVIGFEDSHQRGLPFLTFLFLQPIVHPLKLRLSIVQSLRGKGGILKILR